MRAIVWACCGIGFALLSLQATKWKPLVGGFAAGCLLVAIIAGFVFGGS